MSSLGPSLRRRRPRSWTGWRLLVGVALSLALNLLVLRLVQVDWVGISATKDGPRPVGLAPLSSEQWASNRRVSDGSRPAPPAASLPLPPPKPPEAPKMPGQVVDVAASGNDKPPPSTKFLAESNNTVEKETISRFRKPGYEKTAPQPSQNKSPVTPEVPLANQAAQAGIPGTPGGDTRRPGAPGAVAKETPTARSAPEKVAMTDPDGLRKAPRPDPLKSPTLTPEETAGRGGEGGQGAPISGTGGRPILQPTAAFYDKLVGGPAPDHVEGVDVGDSTFLNTREWKYAGFFNRVKQAIAEHWDPSGAMRARDPSGEKFFYKDRTTLLAIKMNSEGVVTGIKVERSSGLDFLDQTAVDAFEKAQPFLNPPPGLVDSHGEISFIFGFHIEAASGGMRFFRGASR